MTLKTLKNGEAWDSLWKLVSSFIFLVSETFSDRCVAKFAEELKMENIKKKKKTLNCFSYARYEMDFSSQYCNRRSVNMEGEKTHFKLYVLKVEVPVLLLKLQICHSSSNSD